MNHLRVALARNHRSCAVLMIGRHGRCGPQRTPTSSTTTLPARPSLSRLLSQSVRLCQTAPSAKPAPADGRQERRRDGAPAGGKRAAAPDIKSLLEELRSDAVVYRRVQLEKLNQVLAKPHEIPRDAFEFLLGCCGTLLCAETLETRMRVFEQFWFYLGEPELRHWKVLLEVYRENERSITDVPAFLEGMGSIEKDTELYRALLGALAEKGDIAEMKQVRRMLEQMKEPLTVELMNMMIRGNGRAGDLDGVQMVLETMSASNVSANGETYGELMIAFLEGGMAERVQKLVREKGSLLRERQTLELLSLAFEKSQAELGRSLLKLLPEELVTDGRIHVALRNVLSGLVRHGHFEGMLLLLEELPVPQFRPNESTDAYGAFLMVELLRHGAPLEKLIKLLAMLVRTERNLHAYHVACECAAKAGHAYFAPLLSALAPLEALRPHYFWPLFLQRAQDDGEGGVLAVLKMMQKLNVEPDHETIVTYVLPKLAVTLKDARGALKILEDRGVRMAVLMTPFISHLLYQYRFAEVLDIVRRYPTKLDTELLLWPLILQANINRSPSHQRTLCEVLRALQDKAADPKHDVGGQLLLEVISSKKSKHDSASLYALLREYERFEIHISRMAASVLKNHFGRSAEPGGDGESVEALLRRLTDDQLTITSKELFDTISVHPRDMTYDELECHLVELEQKKLNTRGVLRRLLQLAVRENRLDRALELKQRCDEAKVEQSSGMVASLLELYTKRGDAERAGKTLVQLRRQFPGFVIDEHKIIDFAALLVSRGQFDGAKKVLRERATGGGKLRGADGASSKNVWQLLTNTAQKSASGSGPPVSPNTTRKMLDFVTELGYCTYDNALLGPVLREYLLAGHKRYAIEEFQRIAKEKRRTPLQLEILTLLVGLTNGADPASVPVDEAKALLSDTLQVVSQIHGPVNTNNTLIVALADAGTEAQLRRMLINPEVRINHAYILTQCEFLVASGKLDVVLRLAKCSKGLANVRENDFLQLVLGQYVRENNCEAAVQLFQRLVNDEDELKVTGDFARKLSNLLEANNYEIPPSLQLYLK